MIMRIEFINFSVIIYEKYSVFIFNIYIKQDLKRVDCFIFKSNTMYTKKMKPNFTFKYNLISIYLL